MSVHVDSAARRAHVFSGFRATGHGIWGVDHDLIQGSRLAYLLALTHNKDIDLTTVLPSLDSMLIKDIQL